MPSASWSRPQAKTRCYDRTPRLPSVSMVSTGVGRTLVFGRVLLLRGKQRRAAVFGARDATAHRRAPSTHGVDGPFGAVRALVGGSRDVSREPSGRRRPGRAGRAPDVALGFGCLSRGLRQSGRAERHQAGALRDGTPASPVPPPRSTSSSRDRRREPRAPGVRRGPSPPPERAAHRRTAPRLRARVQDADFLAPRPPLPDASTPSTGRLPEPPPRVHHPPTRANPRRQPHPSDPPPPPSPPLPRVVVLFALLRRLPVVVGRRPPRFVAVVFPERIFPRHPSRSRGSFSFRRGCAR